MIKDQPHYDVFVSYAREDIDFARELVRALKAKNISVWYDQGELRFGDNILRSLEDGLERSDFFLLLLSPEYFNKQWTQFETGVALGRMGKGRILPIFLHTPQEIKKKGFFAHIMGIEAEKYSLEEIASMVSEVIKKRNDEKQVSQSP
ncbi:MAG: toll/interleukin-1 receptor domain-containing protein [Candidatus Aminicenantes bacterium]|nr:MAG: toll/interleukin-1 receptor domain-containing protein [Candidatus Aminicenantes bacterium]